MLLQASLPNPSLLLLPITSWWFLLSFHVGGFISKVKYYLLYFACLAFLFSSFLFFSLHFFLQKRVFCSVDQAGLKLRDPPASVSWALGLELKVLCHHLLENCVFFPLRPSLFPLLKNIYFILCIWVHYSSSSDCSCLQTRRRHLRRGHRIPLQMVVSHHVFAKNWAQDLWKNS